MDFAKAFEQALPDLIVAAATGLFALFVGSRLAVVWNTRHKQREMDLANAAQFHRLYGEFFAVWKLWNCFARDIGEKQLSGASRWELLKRASDAEGGIEAILGTLASQRALSPDAIADLGRFRQAFQSLREAIRGGQPLDWGSSANLHYRAFKQLATSVAALVHAGHGAPSQSARKQAAAWLRVTSNEWEDNWAGAAAQQGHANDVGQTHL